MRDIVSMGSFHALSAHLLLALVTPHFNEHSGFDPFYDVQH